MKNPKYAYTASYTTESAAYNRYSAGDGVHVYRISENGDMWDEIQCVQEPNPAFIGFGRNKGVIYVAHSASPEPVSGLVAYAVDKKSGLMTKMARQLDFGKPICCFCVHKSDQYMVAADFKGTIYAIALNQDGSLKEITDTVALEGELGPLTKVQKCSRPHHIPFDLDGNFLVIPDKGYDLVHVYRLNIDSGKLEKVSETAIRPASCARHMAFHPNRRTVYMAAEFTSKVYVFDYDAQKGCLTKRQIISAERSTYVGNYCKSSEIAVHPNGKFLYVSNRGDNTIGVFAIDALTGELTPLAWQETQGEIPRYFCLSDDGSTLYVGNQKSGNVAVFNVDAESGMLFFRAPLIPVPCPTWILFSENG